MAIPVQPLSIAQKLALDAKATLASDNATPADKSAAPQLLKILHNEALSAVTQVNSFYRAQCEENRPVTKPKRGK